MFPAIALVVCLGLASAGPALRAKRQANCPDAFQNVPNPCLNNPTGEIYYPHPSDNTKFIQCDLLGRMYIIQCPAGERYSVGTSSCTTNTITKPSVRPPVTSAPVTRPPVVPTVTVRPDAANPCSAENLQRGNIYFAYAYDKYRFIECDMLGHANILNCPSGLVWEQSRLSCVYEIGTNPVVNPGTGGTGTGSGSGTGTGTGTGTGSGVNLATVCSQQGVTTNDLFHPYPGNKSKFIQCDLWGQANVVDCPTNLQWNDFSKTCASPYIVNGVPASSLTG